MLNEILEFIYKSKSVKASAKRITKGDDLWQDLISELIIIISEMKYEVVESLYKDNKLEIYCYKIMYYQWVNPNMPFYKNFRTFESELINIKNIDENNIDEQYDEVMKIMEEIEQNISKKRFPSEVRLLELYAEHKSFRKVAKEIGISFKTVQYMVRNLTTKIKQKYDFNNN